MTTLAQARQYLAWRWSVIPLQHAVLGESETGKRPALPEWLTYQQRRASDDELATWFTPVPGIYTHNLGIVCGAVSDGLVVIDCDSLDTYNALCFAYRDLGASLTVSTGKGRHIYCYSVLSDDGRAIPTTKFLHDGMTHHVKAEGSYVVAPPSMHYSGRQYAFVNPSAPPIVLDPLRLRDAFARIGALRAPERADWKPTDPSEYARWLREGAREGERNDLTTRLAAHLWARLRNEDEVMAILEPWCARCDQPWTERDVALKVRTASAKFS